MKSPQSTTSKVLNVLGLVMVLIGIVKAAVIGYYDSDLPWLLPLVLVGALLLFVAQRVD